MQQTNKSVHFCQQYAQLWLSMVVNGPTHSQGNTLDLVITNIEERIDNLTIYINSLDQFILQSDHCAITYTISAPSTIYITYCQDNFNFFLS